MPDPETGAVVQTGFVDRVEHMDELRSLMADVTAGRGGRATVVDGVSGMGKSALLRAFEAEVAAAAAPGAAGACPCGANRRSDRDRATEPSPTCSSSWPGTGRSSSPVCSVGR